MKLDRNILKWVKIAKKTMKKNGGGRRELAVLYLGKKRSAAHIPQTHSGSCVREL